LKAWSVWAVVLAVALNPIILLDNSVVKEDCSVSPQEVFKVEGASGDLTALV
jgi:hypothetical protein